jgi:hypothetical protein
MNGTSAADGTFHRFGPRGIAVRALALPNELSEIRLVDPTTPRMIFTPI